MQDERRGGVTRTEARNLFVEVAAPLDILGALAYLPVPHLFPITLTTPKHSLSTVHVQPLMPSSTSL